MARRRVGGDYSWVGPVAVLAALGGLTYVFVTKILPSIQSGSSTNNKGTTDANAAAAAASQAAATAAGIQPTLNANEIANISSQVYSLGRSASGASDLQGIIDQLSQCNNIADLNGVITAFGTKNIPSGDVTSSFNTCFSLGLDCTAVGLATFVHTIFMAYDPTGDYLENLNSYFSSQGINYTF